MKRLIATAWLLAMTSGVVWASQAAAQSPSAQQTVAQNTDNSTKKQISSKQTKKKGKAAKNAEIVAPAGEAAVQSEQPPAQVMPSLPATLMNSAPVPPLITMEGGMLTIDAPNSVLNDVLNGVHKVTGAIIEGASPMERVAVKLGPGIPEDVLDALLRGTPYDYIIMGTLGRQDAVARVMLTPQSSAANGGQPAQQNSAALPPQQEQQPVDEGMPDRTPPDDTPDNTAQQVEQDPSQQQTQQPQQTPQQQPQGQPDPNAPKTPEQLFKELQQLEQQKQQR